MNGMSSLDELTKVAHVRPVLREGKPARAYLCRFLDKIEAKNVTAPRKASLLCSESLQ